MAMTDVDEINIMCAPGQTDPAIQDMVLSHCENMRYRFAVLDAPPGLNAQQAKEWRNYINFDTSFAALYYPWIKIADLSGTGSTTKMVPPSGHVVGELSQPWCPNVVSGALGNYILQHGNHDSGREGIQHLSPIGKGLPEDVTGPILHSEDGLWPYPCSQR